MKIRKLVEELLLELKNQYGVDIVLNQEFGAYTLKIGSLELRVTESLEEVLEALGRLKDTETVLEDIQIKDYFESLVHQRMTMTQLKKTIGDYFKVECSNISLYKDQFLWSDTNTPDYVFSGSTELARVADTETPLVDFSIFVLATKEQCKDETVYYITEVDVDIS